MIARKAVIFLLSPALPAVAGGRRKNASPWVKVPPVSATREFVIAFGPDDAHSSPIKPSGCFSS